MTKKYTFLLIVMLVKLTITKSQHMDYDTTILSTSPYEKLNFTFGNAEMQYFVVTETDVKINDGEIVKNKQTTDTISIKKLGEDVKLEKYEIELSPYSWKKFLFLRECNYLAAQIEAYPTVKISRNKSTNELSFLEPEIIGPFVKSNFEKSLECIENTEDKFMRRHIIDWIEKLEEGDVNHFSTALTSYVYHIFSLYELIVPAHHQDTVICKMSKPHPEYPIELTYQTTKFVHPDSGISIHLTDEIEGVTPLLDSFGEGLYRMFEKHMSEEERANNEIIIQSRKSIDKSLIILDSNNELTRYLRTMESFMLNVELRPTRSFYNFEIRRVSGVSKD